MDMDDDDAFLYGDEEPVVQQPVPTKGEFQSTLNSNR